MRRQSVFSGSFHLTMVCLLSLVALLRAGAAEAADTPPGPTATEHAATVKAIAAAADRAASAATDAASSATTVAAAARGLVSALVPSTTPDTYPVKCAYVRQTGINAYLLNIWERWFPTTPALLPAPKAVENASTTLAVADKDVHYASIATCPDPARVRTTRFQRTLAGGGELIVVVSAANYDAVTKGKTDAPFLFLNGVNQGLDAKLISAEPDAARANFGLLYKVAPGTVSQPFWTRLYAEHSLTEVVPLSVGLGWKDEPIVIEKAVPAEGAQPYVSVTDPIAETLAFLLGLVLVGFFLWSLLKTDTFRDAPLPVMWGQAMTLRLAILTDISPGQNIKAYRTMELDVAKADPVKLAKVINGNITGFAYVHGSDEYESAVVSVYAQSQLPSADRLNATIVGLALQSKFKRPLRLSYSLARVQWGTWMVFATLAAIFLWVVYGSFPVLNGSVFTLVAVSTVTAGASALVDVNNQTQPHLFSRGLIRDMMTSPDDTQQAHRYQALVVNVLLLTVGLVYVVQHLAYPIFDTSWLGMLTLSGVAQTAGKQFLETPLKPTMPAAQVVQAVNSSPGTQTDQALKDAQAAQAAKDAQGE